MTRVGFYALVVYLLATGNAGSAETLRVALFPWVPNPEGINEIVKTHWQKRHPEVVIEFVTDLDVWDGGYDLDPPDNIDVFEIDAFMLDYFVRNNFALPLRRNMVEEIDDFYDFSLRGSMVNGQLFGIPRLSCTPMIFYRKGDAAIAGAKGVGDLFRIIGANADPSTYPPKGKGLLIDFTSGTICACYYLDCVADSKDIYSVGAPLQEISTLDRAALGRLRLFTMMAGKQQATCEECYDLRAGKFAEGYGRILIGWSERLAKMPPKAHLNIAIRSLPLADDNGVNLLFVDTLLINSTLSGRKQQLALDFANLAASVDVVIDSMLVKDETTGSPQYLLPVRRKVISDARLLKDAPLYGQLTPILEQNPRTFRLDSNVRYWLDRTKSHIRSEITVIE